MNLSADDEVFQIGRVLRNRVDHGVAEGFALLVPRAVRSLYGAYCTKQERMCFPGGATEGSVSEGITMSM